MRFSEATFKHGLNFALECVQELAGGEGGERKVDQNASEQRHNPLEEGCSAPR